MQICRFCGVFVPEELTSPTFWASEWSCRDVLKSVRQASLLTWNERCCIQLLPPGFADFNHLLSLFLCVCFGSLFVCMVNQLSDVLRVQRVHHVPEIVSVGEPSFRKLVWKVPHEVWITFHLGPNVFDSKFVINGHVYKANVLQFE